MSEVMEPTIQNLTLTNADTEYTLTLPSGTRYFSVQTRDGATARRAWVTGKVATPTNPYVTVQANQGHNSPEKVSVAGTSLTMYFASSSAGTVVEVESWKSLHAS